MHRFAAALLSLSILSLGAAPDGAGGAGGGGGAGGSSGVGGSGGNGGGTTPAAPKSPDRPAATPPTRGASSGANSGSTAKPADGATARPGTEFPAEWFWGSPAQRAAHTRLVGKPAPGVYVKDWRGEQQDLAKLKGKVVVLDFFGTWCGPCMKAVPENIAMAKKYGKDGLVFIGIHDSKKGVDSLDAVIKGKKIDYPVAVDDAGKSVNNYAVQFWPTYVVIDRKGNVRAAGLQPDHVEAVVKKLLAEPADGAAKPKDAKDAKAADKPVAPPAGK